MRNLWGVNGGKDFFLEYIYDIFYVISMNEIILFFEYDNKYVFDYVWKELFFKFDLVGLLVLCDMNIYDVDMFVMMWNVIVLCLFFVFMLVMDDMVYVRVIIGFDECVRIVIKYGNSEVLDEIVYWLGYILILSSEGGLNMMFNIEV